MLPSSDGTLMGRKIKLDSTYACKNQAGAGQLLAPVDAGAAEIQGKCCPSKGKRARLAEQPVELSVRLDLESV